MNIGSIETNFSVSTSSCYNHEKGEIKSMSSLIVGYTPTNCIIAADSRNTKMPSSKYFDHYPKLFKIGNNVVIGVVGVNSYYSNGVEREVGEFISTLSRDYEAELLYFAARLKRYISKGRITQFVIVEATNSSIVLREINVTNEEIYYVRHDGTEKYITYGVQHCRSSLLHDFSAPLTMPRFDIIKDLIKMDKEADEVVNKPGTVGGPIQAYSVTIGNIRDISDANAPHDFDKYFEEYKTIL